MRRLNWRGTRKVMQQQSRLYMNMTHPRGAFGLNMSSASGGQSSATSKTYGKSTCRRWPTTPLPINLPTPPPTPIPTPLPTPLPTHHPMGVQQLGNQGCCSPTHHPMGVQQPGNRGCCNPTHHPMGVQQLGNQGCCNPTRHPTCHPRRAQQLGNQECCDYSGYFSNQRGVQQLGNQECCPRHSATASAGRQQRTQRAVGAACSGLVVVVKLAILCFSL